MSHAEDFEQELQDFSDALYLAANWKANFFGASYRTRVAHAIDHARQAANKMETFLRRDPPFKSEKRTGAE